MYLWEWESPGNDGKFGAVHGTDVAMTFHDWRGPITGSGSAAAKIMADRLASAMVAFAKTGNPNNPLLPQWPTYDPKDRATMMFNTHTRVENDPRREFLNVWKQEGQ
jgi:para-nitrobenzyl esterase